MDINGTPKTKGYVILQAVIWFTVTASLALVSTIALSAYLRTVYFEEDLEKAAELSLILEENPMMITVHHSAHDIRQHIRNAGGQAYDFDARTPNAGLFYISTQNKVVVSTFEEIGDFIPVADDDDESIYFHSPEELFGEGVILLSTGGSVVSETVHAIRGLAESPFVDKAYTAQYRKLNRPLKHLFEGSHRMIGLLKTLMVYYSPDVTLFANNTYWLTAATEGSAITNILFADGISNIPAYDLGLVTSITEVTLPVTVRTIERDAFMASFSPVLESIAVTSSSTVRIFEGAVADGVDILLGDFEEVTLDELTDYSGQVDFSVDAYGTFKVDFSRLEIRSMVTEYRVVRIGARYFLYIFSDEGLIGYAEGILSYD